MSIRTETPSSGIYWGDMLPARRHHLVGEVQSVLARRHRMGARPDGLLEFVPRLVQRADHLSHRSVLGVRPTGAGFGTVEICPHLGDLASAEGDVPTPQGLIHVRVERKQSRLSAVVKLPPVVSATILLGDKLLKADRG